VEVSKKHGASEQTIYTWRKRFGATNADEVKRLRQLEVENARLRKMLAEGKGLSRRRACALLDVSRSCLGYVSRLDFLLELAPSASSQLTLRAHPRGCVKIGSEIHIVRTNIEIDDQLMSDVLRLTGARTKREAVEMGLRTLARLRQQEEIRRFRGKFQWEGDLDAMRADA
jgi:Arc/MetJ family transcription regulator